MPITITFGIIVLNGEPFTRYCLRQLYPHAHQIIVVEGAAPGARNVATPDGHSRDATLETLRDFASSEDPEGKLTIVTAEDEGHADGFWPGEKDAMSQAYARRATGDYLWQVDVDEFYMDADLRRVAAMLAADPGITALSFRQITFWGSPRVVCDSLYLRGYNMSEFHRAFRWGAGYQYVTHRPPTVVDAEGRDTRSLKWLSARDLEAMGIYMYHCSLLLPKQVREKCEYYSAAEWARREGANRWARECYEELQHPFRVHNVYRHIGWLRRCAGPWPGQMQALWRDLEAGLPGIDLRPMDDVDRLLGRPAYRVAGRLLQWWGSGPMRAWVGLKRRARRVWILRQLMKLPHLHKSRRLRGLLHRQGRRPGD